MIFAFLLMMISGMFSSCSAMLEGGTVSVLGTSFTAEDEDIIGVNDDYRALEEELQRQIDGLKQIILAMTNTVTSWTRLTTIPTN